MCCVVSRRRGVWFLGWPSMMAIVVVLWVLLISTSVSLALRVVLFSSELIRSWLVALLWAILLVRRALKVRRSLGPLCMVIQAAVVHFLRIINV